MTVASVYVHSGDAEKPVQQEKYRFLEAMTKKFQAAQKQMNFFWPAVTSMLVTANSTLRIGKAT